MHFLFFIHMAKMWQTLLLAETPLHFYSIVLLCPHGSGIIKCIYFHNMNRMTLWRVYNKVIWLYCGSHLKAEILCIWWLFWYHTPLIYTTLISWSSFSSLTLYAFDKSKCFFCFFSSLLLPSQVSANFIDIFDSAFAPKSIEKAHNTC